ncbi:MAG: WG repeat-containing protein, partial [Bacteroidota bacterium]
YNGKYGYINKNDEIVIPFKYQWAFLFFDGLAQVQLNGKWGYINADGKEVIPLKYDSGSIFQDGSAKVKLNNVEFQIDKQGNCIKNCP